MILEDHFITGIQRNLGEGGVCRVDWEVSSVLQRINQTYAPSPKPLCIPWYKEKYGIGHERVSLSRGVITVVAVLYSTVPQKICNCLPRAESILSFINLL